MTTPMSHFASRLALPLLRRLDPETAHGFALRGLALGLGGVAPRAADPRLAGTVGGVRFANPLGLAAGFDKNGVAVVPLLRLGFGAVEIGTVTPLPQAGNPRPRLFRLTEDAAAINRLGFNNAGLAALCARLAALPRPLPGVLGANIGPNREGAVPERDYPALYAAVAPFVDYVVVNVSSPNTPGLRALQDESRLGVILAAMAAGRAGLDRAPPVFVKLGSDLPPDALPPIIEACVAGGVAALILGNTSLERPAALRSRHRAEAGGLSGQPIFATSTALLAPAFRAARGRLALVGVGGIATPAQALAKLRAGASLLQLYTGFAAAGPALVPALLDGLSALLRRDGFATLTDAIGVDA